MKLKDVIGYEGHYKVDDSGNIYSAKNPILKKMNVFLNPKGYPRITLSKHGKIKQFFVHRLVAETFLGKVPDGYSVNHIDGNKQNNDLSNLEIITHAANIAHSFNVLGKRMKAIYMLDAKTHKILKEFPSTASASMYLGVRNSSIYRACSGERNFAGGYAWAFKEEYGEDCVNRKKLRLIEGLK